jgi:hypothetical protein
MLVRYHWHHLPALRRVGRLNLPMTLPFTRRRLWAVVHLLLLVVTLDDFRAGASQERSSLGNPLAYVHKSHAI